MASISSLSSTTSAALGSLRGYGGLATGLDRDSLIESFTYGTKSKIQAKEQKKQTLEWKQEAVRGISNKLVEFAKKYTSYTNPATNLSSTSMFARNLITAKGDNSKYVSVSGSLASPDSMSIVGIKQMASNAKAVSTGNASSQTLETGAIQESKLVDKLAGTSITFTYGSQDYRVDLSDEYDYSTSDKAAESIKKQMEKVSVAGGKKLSDVIDVISAQDPSGNPIADGPISFVSKDTAGNTVAIKDSTGGALETLGFNPDDDLTLSAGNPLTGSNGLNLQENKSWKDILGGQEMRFTYNGTSKTIKLPESGDLTSLDDLQSSIQTQLDKAFGKNRINVKLDGSFSGNADGTSNAKLSFETVKPDGSADNSSILQINSAGEGVLGENGILGVQAGSLNRINMDQSLGLTTDQTIKVNGEELTISADSTYESLIRQINNADLGVKMSYLNNADKFVIEATDGGASGLIQIEGDGGAEDVVKKLFGGNIDSNAASNSSNMEVTKGKDAILSVQYAGSNTPTEVTRGSNSFKLDGMNVTLKGTFGYNSTGSLDPTAEAITFDATADADKIVDAVKSMIEDFNSVLELANKEATTKPNRDYKPLTDDQKEALSEDEIKKWEAKAKEGLLFNDSNIRSLTSDLRFVFNAGSEDSGKLAAMGINVSSDYTDNGKLVFNETKFRAALAEDPETVSQLFTRPATDEDGGGLMTRMKAVTDKYASTTGSTKGSLIEYAGSTSAPTSILKNYLKTEMDDLDDIIDRLNDRLEAETDRYIKQFTALETLTSQMNSQSGWLQSMMGG